LGPIFAERTIIHKLLRFCHETRSQDEPSVGFLPSRPLRSRSCGLILFAGPNRFLEASGHDASLISDSPNFAFHLLANLHGLHSPFGFFQYSDNLQSERVWGVMTADFIRGTLIKSSGREAEVPPNA